MNSVAWGFIGKRNMNQKTGTISNPCGLSVELLTERRGTSIYLTISKMDSGAFSLPSLIWMVYVLAVQICMLFLKVRLKTKG